MSQASIKSNNEAIAYINDAIKEYRESFDKIKNDNENALSDAILEDIEKNIGYLSELVGNLNSLNTKINTALKEKEERLAQAAREAEAAAAAQQSSSNNQTNTNKSNNKSSNTKATATVTVAKSSGNNKSGKQFLM